MKRLATRALVLMVALLLGAVGGAVWVDRTMLADLPQDLSTYRDWHPPTNVVVTDSDGAVVDRFHVERREWVPLDDLPDHVWQAFVAAEDKRFLQHNGVDALGVARALVSNAMGSERTSGASTLTQQLVKNLLVGKEHSYRRKVREAVLAWRLERDVGKRRILELYLNYIALGSGNYGVQAASRDYFGIDAADLDPGQAALLAGLVPAPSRYSPRRAPDIAHQRRLLVLGRMTRAGYLTPDEAAQWADVPVHAPERTETVEPVNAAYITGVRREVRRLFGTDAPFQQGFQIRTPLRQDLQAEVVAAVQEATELHLDRQGALGVRGVASDLPPASDAHCFRGRAERGPRSSWNVATTGGVWPLLALEQPVTSPQGPRPLRSVLVPNALLLVCHVDGGVQLSAEPWAQAAAVVVHHPTGAVVGIAGGRQVPLEGFDRATQGRRQPGSSFKPYVYAAALERGGSQLATRVDGPLVLGNWSPRNYGGGYAGTLTLRQALARSTNTIAIRLALEAGMDEVVRVARGLGVRTPLRRDPTVALGSSEVTPLDQAMGYAALVRGGVPVDPVWIGSLETIDGQRVLPGESVRLDDRSITLPGAPGGRIVSRATAYQVVDMLREVVRGGTARRAFEPTLDRGGKTGTTNDFVDAWFVGFTAEHVIAVWVGTDGVDTLGDKETGGRAALPAWIRIANALGEAPGERVPAPAEVAWVDHGGIQVAIPWRAVGAGR